MTRALLMVAPGQPLEIHDITHDPLQPGDVRVRVVASGVCHSDLHVVESASVSMRLPTVIGHEAAGIVLEAGADVHTVRRGDHVVLAVMPQCGECEFCTTGYPTMCVQSLRTSSGTLPDGTIRARLDGQPIGQHAGLGAWSEETIISAGQVVRIDPDMPLVAAALLGCGVVTGYGAVTNAGQVRPGDSVAVIGCGGVGLSAIQAARIAGAERIVAIDVTAEKLDQALRVGATDTVNSSAGGVTERVLELTAGLGVRVGLDFVGVDATTATVMAIVRRGGTVVLTGLAGGTYPLSVNDFVRSGRTVRANLMGMTWFDRELPELVRRYQEGALLLDELVTQQLRFEEVEQAFAAMRGGSGARSVLIMS